MSEGLEDLGHHVHHHHIFPHHHEDNELEEALMALTDALARLDASADAVVAAGKRVKDQADGTEVAAAEVAVNAVSDKLDASVTQLDAVPQASTPEPSAPVVTLP